MDPQQLALTAGALARMQGLANSIGGIGGDHSEVVRMLLDHAGEQMGSFSFGQLSDLLWAVARLHAATQRRQQLLPPDGWADAAVNQLQAQLPTCRAGEMATALWAIGTLGWKGQRAQVAARLLWRSERLLDEMGPGDLAKTAMGLARLGMRPPQVWLFHFLRATEGKLAEGSPQALSNTAWALASLGARPSERWLDGLCAAVTQPATLKRFSAKEMGLLLFALGKWRHVPRDAAQWRTLQARLRAVLRGAGGRTLALVAPALGRLQRRRAPGGGSAGVDRDDGGVGVSSWASKPGSGRGSGAVVVEPGTAYVLMLRAGSLAALQPRGVQNGAGPPLPRCAGFEAADLAEVGKGLALLAVEPNAQWLSTWRGAVERADAALDVRGRGTLAWATAVLEGRASVEGCVPGYGEDNSKKAAASRATADAAAEDSGFGPS
jgi:hypothetical protein